LTYGTLSCRAIASAICSSVQKAFSTSTRPSRRPERFCCSSALRSCSCVISFCATSTSPNLTFVVLRATAAWLLMPPPLRRS
jgi:hypothetical protein